MLPHPRKKRTTTWWVVSLTLHALAIGALVYFTPLREWLFETKAADPVMPEVDPRRIRELQQALLDKYQRSLGQSAQRLNNIVTELNRLQFKRLKQIQEKDPQLVDATPAPLPFAAEYRQTGKDVSQFYAECAASERVAIEGYERVRGLDMAGRQYQPVSRAIEINRIAKPERRSLNSAALATEITTMRDGKFEAFKKALLEADLEAKEMVAFNERLLLLAKAILGEAPATGMIQWDVGDLEANSQGNERFEEGKPYVGAVLLPHEIMIAGTPGRFGAEPAFGRKIAAAGAPAEWLSLDSWWIIGPFSHPGRQNLADLDKKYPPEEILDLGAVYLGKNGQRIGWKYRFTRWVRIEPAPEDNDRYAIWYAYTEIYSDRDQDLWVSFGSDDYSKVWLEGKLVYTSGKQVKPWAPNQDYRKLHLKQGHNRVLVKLENAGGTTGFSIVLCLDPNL